MVSLSPLPYFDEKKRAINEKTLFTVSLHADMVKIAAEPQNFTIKNTPSRRGKVTTFSNKSRKRMIERLAESKKL